MKIKHYTIHCSTEGLWKDHYLPEGDPEPTTCPVDTGHTVTSDSASVVGTIGPDTVEITNIPNVVPKKPSATRVYAFSIDFTKRVTWWHDAVKITDEAFVGDGVATTFQLAHGSGSVADEAILDLTRGLVTDDHLMAPPGGASGDYKPVVMIDGAPVVMRKPYEVAGGDWWLDFVTGLLTFAVAPTDQVAITVTYYYVPATTGPVIDFGPPAGKKWSIEFAEAQVSKDVSFDDCIIMQVFGYGGTVPLSPQVRYENVGNILDYSYGSFIEYPVIAGTNGRGTTQANLLFRWEYLSPIVLYSSLYGGMSVKSWTENQRSFGGERMVIVFYALEEPE